MLMVERRYSTELREAKEGIARPCQRRKPGSHFVDPTRDLGALWSGEDGLAQAVDISNHVHAFQHGLTVIFHENRDHPPPYEPDHRLRIVLENDCLLQMQMLEGGNHAHPKAERTVLEQVESHVALSVRRDAAGAEMRSLVGAHSRPWQQFSVR